MDRALWRREAGVSIAVRPLTVADVAAMRELRLEGLRLHPECFAADHDIEAALTLDDFAARMNSATTFGGFLNDELAGMVVFVQPPRKKVAHTGELAAMYVRALARGTGLSDALVEAAIDLAVEKKVEQLKLTVNAENPHAVRLYERHGFRELAKFPNSLRVGGRTYDEIIMLRSVSATD
jgi:ribosomal protein S18 acetylase RimI-like enzyme